MILCRLDVDEFSDLDDLIKPPSCSYKAHLLSLPLLQLGIFKQKYFKNHAFFDHNWGFYKNECSNLNREDCAVNPPTNPPPPTAQISLRHFIIHETVNILKEEINKNAMFVVGGNQNGC